MQLHRHRHSFQDAGARIVLVGLGDPNQSEDFRQTYHLEFPIICDPDKLLYTAYGLGRTSITQMASPSLFAKGIKTMLKGHRIGIPTGDVKQLAGVFIIDAKGRIRFSHRADNPADHPPPSEILASIEELKRKS